MQAQAGPQSHMKLAPPKQAGRSASRSSSRSSSPAASSVTTQPGTNATRSPSPAPSAISSLRCSSRESASFSSGRFCGIYSLQDLKSKFAQIDSNGDELLSFVEMSDLLRSGNPQMSEDELQILWKALDLDNDDKVDFDEFVNFIFNNYSQTDVTDWKAADAVYASIVEASGRSHMILRDFLQLCVQRDLYDIRGFGITEAEALFAKTKIVGAAGLGRSQFRLILKRIAKKKTCPTQTIVAWVASQ